MRYLLTLLINEDIDCVNDETGGNRPLLDERYVGRHIDSKKYARSHEHDTAGFFLPQRQKQMKMKSQTHRASNGEV